MSESPTPSVSSGPASNSTASSDALLVRDDRLSAAQHRVFFAMRASLLTAFFVWLFFFKDNFTDTERTWITVALIGAVIINVLIARVLQQSRVILAIEGSQLTAAIAPHEYPQTLDLTTVTRAIAHRQYVMLERPGQKPVQLIFTGKFRPLQARLLSVLTQEFPSIAIERMP